MNDIQTLPMTGAELEAQRRACGYTVQDVADIFGVADRSAKYWERGRGGVPDDVAAWARVEFAQHIEQVRSLHQAMARAPEILAVVVPLIGDCPRWAAAAVAAAGAFCATHPGPAPRMARVSLAACLGDDGQVCVSTAMDAAARHIGSQAQAHKNSTSHNPPE